MLRYLTTSFRIADGRVELRRGLLNRHVLSTPIDRVRTVDVTASLIHRVLGLTTVRIGTGTASTRGDDELDLDGLPLRTAAGALRERPAAPRPSRAEARGDGRRPRTTRDWSSRFDPRWLRFAPFTSSGVVIAAAVLGAGSQLLDSARPVGPASTWTRPPSGGPARPLLVLVPAAGGRRCSWSPRLLAVARLPRHQLGLPAHPHALRPRLAPAPRAVHDPETSMDDDRLRGVSLGEPLGLRLAGGARLSAIVTGLDREAAGQLDPGAAGPARRWSQRRGRARCSAPPDPVDDAADSAHGPAAARRRYTRALTVPRRCCRRPSWSASARRPAGRRGSRSALVAPGRRRRARPPTAAAASGTRWSPATWSRGRAAWTAAGVVLETAARHRLEPPRHLVPAPGRPDHRWSPPWPAAAVGRRCSTSPRRRGAALARDAVPGLVEQFLA